MNKIFILHYQPIEMYPPTQNLIRVLEKNTYNNKLYILSTKGSFSKLDLFTTENINIRIIRLGSSGGKMDKIVRGINYLKFYVGSLFHLLMKWPGKVLYYETLSSFTPYLYKRYFNKKSAVYIHYHEYTSPLEYQSGMLLTKIFHGFEMFLYSKARWLSHTNKYRLELFQNDIAPIKINNAKIFANYPPKNWFREPLLNYISPLKIVYVGSISMDTMYTKKFAEWVEAQNGKVIWHIYSYNFAQEIITYFKQINSKYILLKQGVNYKELPEILKLYNVGVVLYNGHIPNYIYNAPNKLFEYLSCGLDVWYPDVMKGCYPFDTKNTAPSVLRLNFNYLSDYKLSEMVKQERSVHGLRFNAEDECAKIVKCIFKIVFS